MEPTTAASPEAEATATPVPEATPVEVASKPATATPTAKGSFVKGRKRSAEETKRAKISAAFRRKVKASPAVVKDAALRALAKSGGRGPAMVDAFSKEIRRDHGVTLQDISVRGLLRELSKAGILRSQKRGNAFLYSAGGARKATPAKPKSAVKRGRPPRAAVETVTPEDADVPTELAAISELHALLARLGPDQRTRALAWVAHKFRIDVNAVPADAPPSLAVEAKGRKATGAKPSAAAEPHKDARGLNQFIAKHKPKTDAERLLCVVGFLALQGQALVETRDITSANNTTGKRFANTSATVRVAVERKLLERVGDKLRLAAAGNTQLKKLAAGGGKDKKKGKGKR